MCKAIYLLLAKPNITQLATRLWSATCMHTKMDMGIQSTIMPLEFVGEFLILIEPFLNYIY